MATDVKSLGLLVSVGPSHPNYRHALGLAEAALRRGLTVYVYCVDDAVAGAGEESMRRLQSQGLKLLVCAYGARRRDLPITSQATYAGLAALSDLMAGTDRFLGFH